MVSCVVHSVVAADYQKSRLEVLTGRHGVINRANDRVHLFLLRDHVGAGKLAEPVVVCAHLTFWALIYGQCDRAQGNEGPSATNPRFAARH